MENGKLTETFLIIENSCVQKDGMIQKTGEVKSVANIILRLHKLRHIIRMESGKLVSETIEMKNNSHRICMHALKGIIINFKFLRLRLLSPHPNPHTKLKLLIRKMNIFLPFFLHEFSG